MDSIEKKIGYKFNNRDLLFEALTHSSFANEKHNKFKCNERLEFLGDAVLSLISAQFLFENYPDTPEGELSKIRSSLVCTDSLAKFAHQIHLGDYIFLGKGEAMSGGADRSSLLEDAFEALTAAIYLDGGMECAKSFVLKFLEEYVEEYRSTTTDYKTTLQEIIQKNHDQILTYALVGESGPDHNKVFEAEVRLNSNVIGRGKGKSKKGAERAAAKEALRLMGL